jgi:hypothetical protein
LAPCSSARVGRGVVFRVVARGQRETVPGVGTAGVFVDECS